MVTKKMRDFQERLEALGDFWEHIDFPNGVSVGPGRNKEILWDKYLSSHIKRSDLKGKSVLDIGSNAGGNLIEIAKGKPSRLVGLEANTTFFNQAQFVLKECGVDAEIRQYKIAPGKTPEEYAADLGRFDVIFFLGVVYHLNYETNVGILRYIRENCDRCYFSSQLFTSDKRTGVDWSVDEEGHKAMFKDAGFNEIIDIYRKSEDDNWSGLTNQWYFEAR